LRFWNNQVFDELEGVLEAIYQACEERKPPHPQPLAPVSGARGERQSPLTPNPSPPKRGRGEEDSPRPVGRGENPM
jgi:hypothetical protein